jgi:formylglycine-generating enzyme required for sulfatase activity
MGNNPSYFKGDDLPVERVSWDDAQEFIQKLNAMNDGFIYRLPSEAEWEYACRAGTTGDRAGDLDSMAWYGNNSGRTYLDGAKIRRTEIDKYFRRIEENGGQTHPVGQKRPNAFGLYDMHGNVYEWCQDDYHPNYDGAPSDGSVWLVEGGSRHRVIRGGSWQNYASQVRSAYHVGHPNSPDQIAPTIGFRVVASARR